MIASDPSLQTILTTWTFDPQVVLPLALLAGIYGAGLREAAHRERFHRLAGTRATILFGLGLLALLLALCSPLDSYDDWSFTMHMAQHMFLLVVAPPLLLLGKPIPILLLGLPHPVVRGTARLLHRTPWLRLLTRAAVSPRGAWLLLTSSLVFWHLPPLYQAALINQDIHALEWTWPHDTLPVWEEILPHLARIVRRTAGAAAPNQASSGRTGPAAVSVSS
jgi:putative membrane protein